MLKHCRLLHLVLCLSFSLFSVVTAQVLPQEALNAVHRIQVVAVSDDKPLEAAEAFAKDLSASLDLRAYVIHKDGWYKVLLGDFAGKAEMRSGLKRVKTRVKDAWPVEPDNEKVVAVWEKGRRVERPQAEPPPVATPEPELARPRAIREEPRVEPKTEARTSIRKHDPKAEEREFEIVATPTPLPGVVEEDLLATSVLASPSPSLDEIIELDMPKRDDLTDVLPSEPEQRVVEQSERPEPLISTPAPAASLTLPEFSESFEKLAAPPKTSEMPVSPSKELGDALPEPFLKEADNKPEELLIDIDDLQLDDVLGGSGGEAELPFVVPGPEGGEIGNMADRPTRPSLASRPAEPVLLKISPDDSSLLAVGFGDGRIELWDLSTKALRFRNASHTGRICDVSFRFKTQHLSSVSVDGSLKVWTLKDGTEQQSLSLELPDIQDAKFDHANARILVLHQNQLTAVNPSKRNIDRIFPAGEYLALGEQPLGERDRLVCPPKADSALAFDLDCCAPVLFQQLGGGTELALPELFSSPLSAAAFSFSGHFFAIGRGKVVDLEPGKAGVEVYQFLPSGKKQAVSVEFLLEVQAGLEDKVSSLAFSPKSSVLVAGHHNGSVQLFQLFSTLPSGKDFTPELSARAGKVLRTFEGHSARVSSLAFFPDGKRFASVSDDGTLRVWDVASAKELERLSLE